MVGETQQGEQGPTRARTSSVSQSMERQGGGAAIGWRRGERMAARRTDGGAANGVPSSAEDGSTETVL